MKALIKVGYGCNENCTFCHTLDVRHIDGRADDVDAKIDRAAALGHSMVVLSGGEPTVRPELFRWAARVAAHGMDFGLVTNGLVLAYPDVVERLLSLRLRYVYQSVHGGSARILNAIVRADAFDAAWKAVANLSGRGLDYTLNCVVSTQNVDHLRELVDAALPFPDLVLKFSMVQPKGGADRAFHHLIPRVARVAEAVVDAIAYGRERSATLRFAHDGIPLCLLPGFEDLYDDLKTHGYATMIEVDEADFFPVDDKNKVQPAVCGTCALRGPCPGLFVGYHHAFGDGELRPRSGALRSNSFSYVFEQLVPSTAERCPLLDDGVSPWDRGRHLFVRNQGRVGRFRADGRDFADVEIESIKHDLGQIYLDVSRKAAPDDFARDLVPLRRSAMCAGCGEHDACTGMYEPLLEDLFTRDDERVRAWLAGLRGDVLDVGCGDGPYDDVLAERARAGEIRYVGIDPDRERVHEVARRRPWARLMVGRAETLAFAAASFDHIVILRSWNHLAGPEDALGRLVPALRPGGTLTIVDNVAYGLARTRAQMAHAAQSSARFEHYRNDDATMAASRVARFGLQLRERADVVPASSNQWLLIYAREC